MAAEASLVANVVQKIVDFALINAAADHKATVAAQMAPVAAQITTADDQMATVVDQMAIAVAAG